MYVVYVCDLMMLCERMAVLLVVVEVGVEQKAALWVGKQRALQGTTNTKPCTLLRTLLATV